MQGQESTKADQRQKQRRSAIRRRVLGAGPQGGRPLLKSAGRGEIRPGEEIQNDILGRLVEEARRNIRIHIRYSAAGGFGVDRKTC